MVCWNRVRFSRRLMFATGRAPAKTVTVGCAQQVLCGVTVRSGNSARPAASGRISVLPVQAPASQDRAPCAFRGLRRSSGAAVQECGADGQWAASGLCPIACEQGECRAAESIAVGPSACARLTGGTVECWGPNDGLRPSAVANLSGATAIAVGEGTVAGIALSARESFACALLTGGTVECWGDNEVGELGNRTLTNSATPVQVANLSDATAIAAGGAFACALLTGGTVECWGNNEVGELGNGTLINSATPVQVSNLSGATAISVGDGSACALLTGGTVECWGDNGDGELGNGTMKRALRRRFKSPT